MIQLPTISAPTAKMPKAPNRTAYQPRVSAIDCPVIKLLREHEELINARNRLTVEEETSTAGRREIRKIEKRMKQIIERAAGLSPKSYDGATFQVMLAWGEVNTIAYGATKKIRDHADDLHTQLMYRAAERFADGFDWPAVREYFCPESCDPRKFGAR